MAKENGNAPPTPEEPSSDNVGSRRAWIRYRTELCHRGTGDVLHSYDSEEPNPFEFQHRADDEPIFELVTRYTARDDDTKKGGSQTSVPTHAIGSAPSHTLRIYSPVINNALQSVVKYYPQQDLSGSVISIKWPYPILVHHYKELREFKAMCENKEPGELCVREHDAPEHLDLLLRFLDDNIMEQVRKQDKRSSEGYYTFEDKWVIYKPGRTVITHNSDAERIPFVISTVSGGIFHNPPVPWQVRGWYLLFDGEELGRYTNEFTQSPFDGEKELDVDQTFVDDIDDVGNDFLEKSILEGERYWKLLKKQCKLHKGKSTEFPYNEVR